MDYVHVIVRCMGEKVRVSFEVHLYPHDYCQLICQGNCKKSGLKKLFRNHTGYVLCFQCVPWGNWKYSRSFKRIGELVADTIS